MTRAGPVLLQLHGITLSLRLHSHCLLNTCGWPGCRCPVFCTPNQAPGPLTSRR